jgi:hypothetical protein
VFRFIIISIIFFPIVDPAIGQSVSTTKDQRIEKLFSAINSSRNNELSVLSNDSIRNVESTKINNSHTLKELHLVASRIVDLQDSGNCSDSLFLLIPRNACEVHHTTYVICDLRSTKRNLITITVDSVRIKSNLHYTREVCDSLIEHYFFNGDKNPYVQCPIIESCYLIDGVNVEARMNFHLGISECFEVQKLLLPIDVTEK